MGAGTKSKKDVGFGDGLWQRGNSWRFRCMLDGRQTVIVLGSTDLLSLADARIKAIENRKLLAAGVDPLEQRRRTKKERKSLQVTFWQCTEEYIRERGSRWTKKHREQWYSTLRTFAVPVFGELPVQEIDREFVKQVLLPIWTSKNETASRLRGRIEQIIDWATFHNHRTGENPARWRGNLSFVLEKRSAVRRVRHFKALPIEQLGEFVQNLHVQKGVAARALEFLILTACRTSEVLGARWEEVDLGAKIWTIPAHRMKARREHRVPLSERAVEILQEMSATGESEIVFPGGPATRAFRSAPYSQALSNMAFLEVLRRMNVSVTAHGFRSTFRDWAAEKTNFPREVAEAALAHVLRDKTEAAYRRSDLFLKRKRLMDQWSIFCSKRAPMTAALIGISKRTVGC